MTSPLSSSALALAGVVVALLSAVVAGLQARSAARSAKVAQEALLSAKDQAESARKSADATKESADAAVRQVVISQRQLEIEEERASAERGPNFLLTVGPIVEVIETLHERRSPSGPPSQYVRALARTVRLKRVGGPPEIEIAIEIVTKTPATAGIRVKAGSSRQTFTYCTSEVFVAFVALEADWQKQVRAVVSISIVDIRSSDSRWWVIEKEIVFPGRDRQTTDGDQSNV